MENAMRYMTELQLQAKCSQWFWNTFPDQRGMLHNNDNNSFNKIEGARKRAIGVVEGVSDFEFIDFNIVWFLEFKVDKGIQSKSQIDFMNKVRALGHPYKIIYSFEEFTLFIYQRLTKQQEQDGTLGNS